MLVNARAVLAQVLRACVLFLYLVVCVCVHLFRIFSFQQMLQGVTRVDDPVASIDLCQEADVAAAVAGMIPVLKKVPM